MKALEIHATKCDRFPSMIWIADRETSLSPTSHYALEIEDCELDIISTSQIINFNFNPFCSDWLNSTLQFAIFIMTRALGIQTIRILRYMRI